ncbi:unnamed protein product, partial [Ectocarpus sp. 12 AP-2014]
RGEGNGGRHPPGRRGLRQPDGGLLPAGVQAQEPEGHEHQPARPPTAPHGVRAREADPLVVHPGSHRDRLPVRGHRLQLHHHSRPVRRHEPGLLPEVLGTR